MMKQYRGSENSPIAELDHAAIAECSECTCFNLRKAGRIVTQFYDDRMRKTGLRVTQFALLVHAQAMGPVALSKLAEAMGADRTTLARNLELLEKEGVLGIDYGSDRRTRMISITDAGRKKLADAFPLWRKTQEEIKEIIGRDEWSAVMLRLSRAVSQIQGR